MAIILKEIEVSVPQKVMTNDFYIDHFDKQGKDIRGLLNAVGRKARFIAEKGVDTTISLALDAAKKVLAKADLTAQDIDIICVSSQCPEYMWPSQAMVIHGLLKANPRAQVLDMNASCAGMVVAFNTLCEKLIASKKAQRALLIGADCMSYYADPTCEHTYPSFGDSACAVILEKDDSVTNRGYIDSEAATYGHEWEFVRYPVRGYSNTDLAEKKYVEWIPFDTSHIVTGCVQGLDRILKHNNLAHDEIATHCYSQAVLASLIGIQSELEASGHTVKNMQYVGDKYGYTGTTSPFIALYEAIQQEKVKRGDLVSLWTLGITWTTCHVLFRY